MLMRRLNKFEINFDRDNSGHSSLDIQIALMITLTRRINAVEQEIITQLYKIKLLNQSIIKINSQIEGLQMALDKTSTVDTDDSKIRQLIQQSKTELVEVNDEQRMHLNHLQALAFRRTELFDKLSTLLKKMALSRTRNSAGINTKIAYPENTFDIACAIQ